MENKQVKFFELVQDLKEIRRQGWLDHKINGKIESVADHSFGVAFLSLILSQQQQQKILQENAMIMGLLHDIGEVIIGDITPKDGLNPEMKYAKELEAVISLDEMIEINLLSNWIEFERKDTPVAKFVRNLDKLEMLIQSVNYQKTNEKEKLDAFFNTKFSGKFFKGLASRLNSIRKTSISKIEE